jgi:putative transposase
MVGQSRCHRRRALFPLAFGITHDLNAERFDRTCQVAAGIEVRRTPYRAPKANAICERFLGSLRRECLDHILILGGGYLQRTIRKYASYFNHARPHQGIEQRIPCPPESLPRSGKIVSLPILGGLHHDYRRQAA